MMKKSLWAIPITIVFLFIGFLLSLQFQSQNRISSDLSMQRTENLIAMVRDLSGKRQQLAAEVLDLSGKLYVQTQSNQNEKDLYSSLEAELIKLQTVTGDNTLRGPGLSISIEEHMPILYVDIIRIINELWAAGAEAIAVNGFRITQNSSIFYTENANVMSITVNNTILTFPIKINVIGDPNNLEKGLTIPGGIMDNLALYRAYPVIAKVDSLAIPALSQSHVYYFLKEYKPPATPGLSITPPK